MGRGKTTEDPWAEHERRLTGLRRTHDELSAALAKLGEVPEDERAEGWEAYCDEVGTALRETANAIRSAELGRAQVEGFADAHTPATISAEQPEQAEKTEE